MSSDSPPVASTAHVEAELARIRAALSDPAIRLDSVRWCYFYVAQQALVWVLDPRLADAPSNTITRPGGVQPLQPGVMRVVMDRSQILTELL